MFCLQLGLYLSRPEVYLGGGLFEVEIKGKVGAEDRYSNALSKFLGGVMDNDKKSQYA